MNCAKPSIISSPSAPIFDLPIQDTVTSLQMDSAKLALQTLNGLESSSLKDLKELKDKITLFYNAIFKMHTYLCKRFTESECANVSKLISSMDRILAIEIPTCITSEQKEAGVQLKNIEAFIEFMRKLIEVSDYDKIATFFRKSNTTRQINELFLDLHKHFKRQSI